MATPAEHYAEAEKCLTHASAAEFGSPEEDSYLRFAAIHATLATVRQADDICGVRGPLVAGEGVMHCVLPKGHSGDHEPDPSWGQPGWPQP